MTDALASNLAKMAQQATGAEAQAGGGGMAPGQGGIAAFEDAMRAAGGPGGTDALGPITQIQQVQATLPVEVPTATPPVGAVTEAQAADVDARQRALEGLGLGGEAAPGASGQSILDGLSRIRGAFDTQAGHINRIDGASMDAATMMSLQTEVVQYTMLVDVSSKLAGKSTQAIDTLMKGQ